MADIPVYLVAGFLDAGKTNFINGILEEGFARGERTLLLSCEEREEDFHARYSCTGKRYRYRIRNSEIRSPFEQDLVWVYYKYHIDAEALDAAAKGFLGTYDYRAFASPGGSVEDTVAEILQQLHTMEGIL